MAQGSYTGKLLRVNLTEKKSTIETISEDIIRNYIGGRGFGTKYLYDELAPGIDPLSPGNKLLLLTGPLCGTQAQGCSKWMALTKSPASGGFPLGRRWEMGAVVMTAKDIRGKNIINDVVPDQAVLCQKLKCMGTPVVIIPELKAKPQSPPISY